MRTRLITLAIGIGLFGGTAAAQVPRPLPPTTTVDTAVNFVTVQNQRREPVTVYMDLGAFDRRLGVVPPFGSATLPLPAWAARGRRTVQLFAHPEGSFDDLASEEFTLRPPARIGMVIPARDARFASASDTMSAVLPPDVLSAATLTVDNPRAVPVTVYAAHGQFDVRLGIVPARSRTTLRFPTATVHGGSLTVIVHPEGGRDLSSETLRVAQGQHLGLRVPPQP